MQCDVLEKRKTITSHCPLWGLWEYSFILLNWFLLILVITTPYAWLAESKRLECARLAEWVCTLGIVRLHGWQSLTPTASQRPGLRCERG